MSLFSFLARVHLCVQVNDQPFSRQKTKWPLTPTLCFKWVTVAICLFKWTLLRCNAKLNNTGCPVHAEPIIIWTFRGRRTEQGEIEILFAGGACVLPVCKPGGNKGLLNVIIHIRCILKCVSTTLANLGDWVQVYGLLISWVHPFWDHSPRADKWP